MTFKIKNIVERRLKNPALKIAIYGTPGAGKTFLAGTASLVPEMSPVLVVNVGRGIMTLEDFPSIDVVTDVECLEDLEDILIAIRQGKGGTKKYRTIIIDDYGESVEMGLDEMIFEREERTGRTGGPEIQDYNKLGMMLSRFMRWARDSDKNIIFTAWARTLYPKHDGRKENKIELEPLAIVPAFPEAVRRNFEGYFDCLWYMSVVADEEGDSERILVTNPTDVIHAKTRRPSFADKLGTFVHNPSFVDIYGIYLEYLQERAGQPKKKKKKKKKSKKKGKKSKKKKSGD